MAVGRGFTWLQSPLKFSTFLLLMVPVFFLNLDRSSMNQLPAVFAGVQYAFLGFKPSSIETTTRANIHGQHHLPSCFPYALTIPVTSNFLTCQIVLSGDVEANLGPKETNVHQESKK